MSDVALSGGECDKFFTTEARKRGEYRISNKEFRMSKYRSVLRDAVRST